MRTRMALGVVLGVALATACGGGIDDSKQAAVAGGSALTLPPQASPVAQDRVASIPVCPGPSALGDARCHSRVVVGPDGKPQPTPTAPTSGLRPEDLWSAYGLPNGAATSWTWNRQTIAIVDAYDNPNAEADLAVYRAQFGLPPCTTANGCFKKVNQSGGTKPPRANQGWALEIALDVQMASAICPRCKILLVEATSNSFANLAAAVNQAADMGANAISNSYGASEFSSETSYEAPYNHPGIAVTVSSGDSGYGVEFPAASQYVVAVGGTHLETSGGTRGWSETAWSGAGSGCSAYITQPSWQASLMENGKLTGCGNRMVADVSAVADPATGVAVYDSYGYQGRKGWFVVGGTSASAPIIAGVYGLAGNVATDAASMPYAYTGNLFDIVAGSNGSCGGSFLCTAVSGYDGPTGLGTPNGTGAF